MYKSASLMPGSVAYIIPSIVGLSPPLDHYLDICSTSLHIMQLMKLTDNFIPKLNPIS